MLGAGERFSGKRGRQKVGFAEERHAVLLLDAIEEVPMNAERMSRRSFARVGALAAVGPFVAAGPAGGAGPAKIIGVACSPRRGMTTAKAVQAALDAAAAAGVAVELLDLGGLRVGGYSKPPPEDDFTPLLARFGDPAVAGLIIGSPCYFRAPSALCRAFIERLAPLREPTMRLQGKPVGVVAVGAFRNGGQELVIAEILTSMLCFGMVAVGGDAPAFQGATVLSKDDDIAGDELGLDTCRKLGQRMAQLVASRGGERLA
ncbi:MAG: flavodoxin family protein [Kiritimatiellae bacterium]|nr:flavodoxin family protein [Kiritimatiellia bacterium]